VQREYIPMDGSLVGAATGSQIYYVETDQLGTPRQVIQPGATPATDIQVWKWDYFASNSAFGENTPSPQTITFNPRFPGQYFDPETGLDYNIFRNYEANSGRYAQSDPVGLKGGLSSYSYVRSNPLDRTDVKGLYDQNSNEGQAMDASNQAGVWCPIVAYYAKDEALKQAALSGLPDAHNGAQDAFRHCDWSCLMTKFAGTNCAKAVGEIHEAAGNSKGQPADEFEMDNYNNGQGRDAACEPGMNCHEACRKKLQNCELRGLNGEPLCYPPR
jgi:RHS repeat-associated protein